MRVDDGDEPVVVGVVRHPNVVAIDPMRFGLAEHRGERDLLLRVEVDLGKHQYLIFEPCRTKRLGLTGEVIDGDAGDRCAEDAAERSDGECCHGDTLSTTLSW